MNDFYMWVEQQAQVRRGPSNEAAALAYQIVTGTCPMYDGCVDHPTVMYDAIFQPGSMPYFININAKMEGKGLGLVAFLHFLSRVGSGNSYVSTDFTPAGAKLFQTAANMGLHKQVGSGSGLGNQSVWEVTGDAMAKLREMAQGVK